MIQMDQVTGPIELDVSSGHVLLDLPEEANFTLDGRFLVDSLIINLI